MYCSALMIRNERELFLISNWQLHIVKLIKLIFAVMLNFVLLHRTKTPAMKEIELIYVTS